VAAGLIKVSYEVIMAKRKGISKRVRFEVLKRDAFTCQYFGGVAPDVILHIDHIKPVSKGGNNGILNLVTSCQSCNSGKSNIELSDDSAIKKQQKQLANMAEKREQIKLMIEWRESLENADDLLIDSVSELVSKLMVDRSPNEHGLMIIRKAIKKHGYQCVIDSIHKSYGLSSTIEDFCKKWSGGFSYIGKKQDNDAKAVSYIKGILRNRFNHFNVNRFYSEVSKCDFNEADLSLLTSKAKTCHTVSEFYGLMDGAKNG